MSEYTTWAIIRHDEEDEREIKDELLFALEKLKFAGIILNFRLNSIEERDILLPSKKKHITFEEKVKAMRVFGDD